mmetsp:Transcript_74985/g.223459  ORF Transcript_74985/g.223459 Transcript_74985/m.223459 type:complete len:471 (+) Transcript_74985:100-1512(+)|eukprot:CAMPEP_0175224608 /NCGR_PEP_ID=MMETSP0093-20121207/21938_1 /TAXON_ID=311494 /ORGANISM="Alexandrium monilatum, Strain CCMP3105" /LENGTH=470 /DNA_ID=CAMNT_0016518253 /DNA_START=100 /DNA_END=1512 /DNA_ORIENTATION=+
MAYLGNMANVRPTGGSASVCVQFTAEQCPQTFERATAVFAAFGELARVDMSFAGAMSKILVTFFDVRSAELALQTFKGRAKRIPPEAHDFRSVCIASTLFAKLPESFTGFQSFGDLAGVAISGQEMLIEFYDMRAAQRLMIAVPGSRPQPHQAALPSGLGPDLGFGSGEATGNEAAVVPQQSALSGSPTAAAAPAAPPAPNKAASEVKAERLPVAPGAVAQGTAQPVVSANGQSGGAATRTTAAGAPTREKLAGKDLAKFDIVPERIHAGEDSRTTVMVRNIPRVCSRDDLVDLLRQCGTDNYGFFYMPFDKRRDIHCGFAFIDFQTPKDVLNLYETLKEWPRWWPVPPSNSAPPAVSYARLQGQEQLMKHFRVSVVMYDADSKKRPIFYREGVTASIAEKEKAAAVGQDEVDPSSSGQYQPRYVHLSDDLTAGHTFQFPQTGSNGGLTTGVSEFGGGVSTPWDGTLLGA